MRVLFVIALAFGVMGVGETALAAPPVSFTEAFEDAELSSRGWYDGARYCIAGDAAVGQGCIEYHWPEGATAGQGSSAGRHLFAATDEAHVRFRLKLSKGWGWSGRNFHPHLCHVLTTENDRYVGPAATHLTLYIEPVDGRLRLAAQDIENKDAPRGLTQGPLRGGYNGTFYDSKEKVFTDDKWHLIEAQFRLNTIDPATGEARRDGIVRGWFDGELVIEHTDVVLRSGDFPDMQFNQFLMAPYFGPGLLPHPQTLWIDDLTVGPRRFEAADRSSR